MKLSAFLARLDDYYGPDGKGDYVAVCPGHADHSPSLLVGQDAKDGRLLVHCRSGCTVATVVKAMGLTTSDLFSADDRPDTSLPVSKAQADRPGPAPEDIAALRYYTLQCSTRLVEDAGEVAEEARQYVRNRFGLAPEDAAALGVGFDPGGAWYDGPLDFASTYLQVPRITVAFRDFDGITTGLQARALRDHIVRWSAPCNPDDGARTFSKFAFVDRQTGLDTVVLTEGPGDALTVSSAGFDALAIRGAAVTRNEALQAELIEGLRGRRVVLAGDDDDAGRAYNATLLSVFEEAGLDVYVLGWRTAPDGAGDVTAWHEADPRGFRTSFVEAVEAARHPAAATSHSPEGGRFTEVAMARRLRDRLSDGGPGVLYAEGLGFFLWEGTHWTHDRSGHRTRRNAQGMVEALHEEAADMLAKHEVSGFLSQDEEAEWKAQRKAAERFESSLLLGGVLRELEAMVFEDHERMDSHHHLLSVANGTVDLRTGKLGPHRREDLLTRCIPVRYDPSAACPRWERFLTEIFPEDAEMPAFMRRLVGYGITGETSEQAFAVLWGTGANGKSVLTDTLTEVFRAISTTTPFSTFEQKPSGGIPNDLAALNGARLVFASEGEQGRLMAESVIKRVTGQDLISARFMRQEFFEFRPTFLILLATNHKPRFKGQDEGLWRRVKMIPFKRYFAEADRDHHLTRDLRAEYEGILAWAVAGAVEWYDLDALHEPESVRRATSAYRDAADGLLGFVDLYVRPEENGRVRAKDVFERWKGHLIEEGVKESDIWSPRAFYESMEEKGYGRAKVRIAGRPEWALLGMRLLTAEEAAAGLSDGPDPEHDVRPVGKS